jgi:TPR repeat protein
MIDVGYFAGARAYFRRAAEAGSGDAALLLGVTFDPEFIDKIGAQGIKADPQEARGWYERAKQLGVEDAETKIRALKENGTSHHPVQATEAQPEAEAPAPAAVEAEPIAPTVPAVPAEAKVAADDSEAGDATQSPVETTAEKDQWVALLSYANVRAAPSSTADTLRVAEKGAKLRLTGRKGNWVQVTDPTTAEVGWVYSRYIELAEAPAQ